MAKLTVEDFVKINSDYSAVRIEVCPGEYTDLNQSTLGLTEIFKIISSSLSTAFNQYNKLLSDNSVFGIINTINISEEEHCQKMFDSLEEKDVIKVIKYDDYDQSTLDAYRLYQEFNKK